MCSKFNKNVPNSLVSTTTWQELQVKQLLQSEEIPFEIQKLFPLDDRRYIVDFFLSQSVILECASTSMHKYQVPLRNKAIFLEVKSFQLKQHYSNLLIWVLLETYRPILPPFSQTLVKLMPSVDQIFFSQTKLKEALQRNFIPIKEQYEVIH